MTNTIGEILPVAAQRFGAGRPCWSATAPCPSMTCRHCRIAPRTVLSRRASGRATALRSTARTAGSGSSATTPSPRPARPSSRSMSCSRRTRSGTSSRTPARGPWSRRRTRASRCSICAEPGTSQDVVLWGDGTRAGATAFADWLASGAPSSAGPARRRRPRGHLLHVGHDGPPEGRDAAAPRRHRRGCRHGRHGGARSRRSRHQLAAAAPRLRIVRVQRRR